LRKSLIVGKDSGKCFVNYPNLALAGWGFDTRRGMPKFDLPTYFVEVGEFSLTSVKTERS